VAIRDDLRRIGEAARVAATARVRAGLDAAAVRVEQFADGQRVREVDNRLEKAAAQAIRSGNDGNHDFDDPKGIRFDPFDLVAVMGYRDRPSAMTFAAMETVGTTVPVVADIIRTRVNQVCMFVQRPENRHGSGFEVRLRDRGKKMSKAAEKKAEELQRQMLNCGLPDPNRGGYPNDPLLTFAKKSIADTLTFDQWCWEIVPDRKGNPAYFCTLDPSTIRLVDPGLRAPDDPFAVQVVHGSIVSDFTQDELAFCVRNPRSGIRSFGYGLSETESLVREVTGMLWGIEYNRSFFKNGAASKGILNFKGTIPDRHLQAFRRQWYAMVSGVHNAWRTPITNAEELQWINMQLSNRDMEYSAWLDWLIKVACARFQIAPEEVNFSYGNAGQSQAMGQPSIEEKLKASRDLGLRPLVRFFFDQLNRHYLWAVDEDFESVPVGLDEKGEQAEAELLQQLTSFAMTINEAREVLELEPLDEDKGGEVIANPTWLQYVQAKEQAAMMGGMGGEGMEEGMGDDGGFGYDDDEDAGESPFSVDAPGQEGEDSYEPAAAKSVTGLETRGRKRKRQVRRQYEVIT